MHLRRLRKERGLSAEEVGAVVGKSGKAVHAWEVGHSMPSFETIIALCKFFNVPISEFHEVESSPTTIDISDLSSDAQKRVLRIVELERMAMSPGDSEPKPERGVLRVENAPDDIRWIKYWGNKVIDEEA